VPRGTTVNNYIIDALGVFLKIFKQKRPKMAASFTGHTATMVKNWMAARWFQLIKHLPYSPDLAPADFFLFPEVKRELSGLTLTKETFMEWEGAARALMAANFATAFRQWYERCENVSTSLGPALKKAKINMPLSIAILY
jgi:histone-lysine N-methyltransferase SETMAR